MKQSRNSNPRRSSARLAGLKPDDEPSPFLGSRGKLTSEQYAERRDHTTKLEVENLKASEAFQHHQEKKRQSKKRAGMMKWSAFVCAGMLLLLALSSSAPLLSQSSANLDSKTHKLRIESDSCPNSEFLEKAFLKTDNYGTEQKEDNRTNTGSLVQKAWPSDDAFRIPQDNKDQISAQTFKQQDSGSSGKAFDKNQPKIISNTYGKENDVRMELERLKQELQETIAALQEENARLLTQLDNPIKLELSDSAFSEQTRASANIAKPEDKYIICSLVMPGVALACIIFGLWGNFARERKLQKLVAYGKQLDQQHREQTILEESRESEHTRRSDAFVEAMVEHRDFHYPRIKSEEEELSLKVENLNYSFDLVFFDNQHISTEVEATHEALEKLETPKLSPETEQRVQTLTHSLADLEGKVEEAKAKEVEKENAKCQEKSKHQYDTQCAIEYLTTWQANRGANHQLPANVIQMMNFQLCK